MVGKFSNATLPGEISPRFQDTFIPMLLAYCSTIPNPWILPEPFEDLITEFWLVMFPCIPYNKQLYGAGTLVCHVVSHFVSHSFASANTLKKKHNSTSMNGGANLLRLQRKL